MDIRAFLELVVDFVKKLLTYLGEWPFEEKENADPEA